MIKGWMAIGAALACLVAGAPAQAAPKFYPRSDTRPFSEAVEAGPLLYLSGVLAESGDGVTVVPGGIEPEAHRVMDLIGQVLARRGLGYEDLAKCTVLLADMKEWPTFNRIYAGYFKPGHYPARAAMGVNGLALGGRVEVDCVALLRVPVAR